MVRAWPASCGVTRPGYELSDAHLPTDAVTLVDIAGHGYLRRARCRQRVQEELPVWYLVPDGVVQYIGKHRAVPRRRQAASV